MANLNELLPLVRTIFFGEQDPIQVQVNTH